LSVAARAVGFGLPFAILVAWVLARSRFPGRPVLNALVHLPLVLPPVVTGWLLLIMFGIRGPIGSLLNDWFGVRLVFTTAGASLAVGVMTFPVMVRAIRLSLESADRGLDEAARTLGAASIDSSTLLCHLLHRASWSVVLSPMRPVWENSEQS
jgi:molybdate transport system permease protein